MNRSLSSHHIKASPSQRKGRLILVILVLMFALPAIAAKIILMQNWYQSGVTNKGQLVEPRLTYQMLSMKKPSDKRWHFGYVLPKNCDQRCQKQMHLLLQSHTALGKYKHRVTPVLFVAKSSAAPVNHEAFLLIAVNDDFMQKVSESSLLIVDPLGQLVMTFSAVSETELVGQSKNVLFDLRKLLKLSRVG